MRIYRIKVKSICYPFEEKIVSIDGDSFMEACAAYTRVFIFDTIVCRILK